LGLTDLPSTSSRTKDPRRRVLDVPVRIVPIMPESRLFLQLRFDPLSEGSEAIGRRLPRHMHASCVEYCA